MTNYGYLLMRSGTLELIEQAIDECNKATAANATDADKEALKKIKDILKRSNE